MSVWKDRSITMVMYAWGDKKLIIWWEGGKTLEEGTYLFSGRRRRPKSSDVSMYVSVESDILSGGGRSTMPDATWC